MPDRPANAIPLSGGATRPADAIALSGDDKPVAISNTQWFEQTYGRDYPTNAEEFDNWHKEQFGVWAPQEWLNNAIGPEGVPSIDTLRRREDPEGALAAGIAANGPVTGEMAPVEDWLDVESSRVPTVEQMFRGAGQAVFGLGDEIAGAVAGAGAAINPWDPRTFSEAYQNTAEHEREQLDQFRQINPTGAMLTEVIPALATMALPAGWAARAATLPGRVARTAGTGAAANAAYNFGAAEGGLPGEEGTIVDRLSAAARGVLPGAAAGAIVPLAAPIIARGAASMYNALRSPANVVRRVVQGATRPAEGVNPADRFRASQEFGIPLTRGQTTGNQAQQAREQAMLQGTRGQAPQAILAGAVNSQNESIRTAAQRISADISGDPSRLIAPSEAGEIVTSAVRRAAQNLQDNAQTGYRTAEQLNPSINPATAQILPQSTAYHLVNDTDFTLNIDEHPTAFRALALIDELASRGQSVDPALRYAANVGAGNVPLTDLMRVRRQINAMTGTNDADTMAIREVKRAYDAAVRDLFDNQMFSGDPAAIQAWREADVNYARFRSMTDPQPGDDAGRIISRIINQDVTPQEVANWMYGNNLINPPQSTARVATALRETLGEDSEAWNAIRSAAWTRLVTAVNDPNEMLTATRIADNITGFLAGRGASTAAVLFTAAERDLMRRFANTVRLTVPDRLATNPSQTSYRFVQMLRPLGSGIAASLGGILSGNWVGAMIGAVGQPLASNVAARLSALRATIYPLGAQPLVQNPETARQLLTTVIGTANMAITPRALQTAPAN